MISWTVFEYPLAPLSPNSSRGVPNPALRIKCDINSILLLAIFCSVVPVYSIIRMHLALVSEVQMLFLLE